MTREHNIRRLFARRVRLLRQLRGWSQEVLGELSGLDRSYIGSVERAERNIGIENIEKIARALDFPVHALLDKDDTGLFAARLASYVNLVREPSPAYGYAAAERWPNNNPCRRIRPADAIQVV